MTEINEITRSLNKTARICSLLRMTTLVFLFIYVGLSLATLSMSLMSGRNLFSICHLLISSMIIIAMLGILVKILHEPVLGQSPFSSKQPKRFIALGVVVFLKFFIDMFTPLFLASATNQNNVFNYAPLASSGHFLDINVTLLLFSLIFVSLSVVFRYGTLLQKLSDETV